MLKKIVYQSLLLLAVVQTAYAKNNHLVDKLPDSLVGKDIIITLTEASSDVLPYDSYPHSGKLIKTYVSESEMFGRQIKAPLQDFVATYAFSKQGNVITETANMLTMDNLPYETHYTFTSKNSGTWEENFADMIHFKGTFRLRNTPIKTDSKGNYTESIEVDGVEREYIIHLPPAFSTKRENSATYVFHGAGSNMDTVMNYSGFNTVADQTRRLITIYPQGLEGYIAGIDQTMNQWDVNWGTGTNDLAFIELLTKHLSKKLNINKKRFFAIGESNGGMFTQYLACQLPNTFSAIASIAANLPTTVIDTCKHDEPIPLIYFHGDADVMVPYEGIANWSLSTEQSLAYYSERNNCNFEYKERQLEDLNPEDITSVTQYKYKDCSNKLRFYKINNGGHTWPGATWDNSVFVPPVGLTNYDINANQLIWRFFKKQSR